MPKGADYDGPQWFAGKRIATSYPRILRKWLQEQGIEARIEVITGSVEIAPAADIADAIFDIVSSGGTLVSNGLREVEKVFFSEAVLISNGQLDTDQQQVLDEMLFRIGSAQVSRHKKYILMNLPQAAVEEATRILPAMRSPTIMPLAAEGWCSMHSVVEEADLWDKIRQLKAKTAADKAAHMPEQMVQNIAKGRMAKFYKESCLLDQEYCMDATKTISQILQSASKTLTVTAYKRFTLRAE